MAQYSSAIALREDSEEQATLTDLLRLVMAFDVAADWQREIAGLLPEFPEALGVDSFAAGADLALQLAARRKMPDIAERSIDLDLCRVAEATLVDLSASVRFSLLGAASQDGPGALRGQVKWISYRVRL